MNFRVVVPVWNARRWIGGCLASIALQRLGADDTLTCCVVDDASTDGTWGIVRSFRCAEWQVIRRSQRVGALANLTLALAAQAPGPDDVCVTVDGDDRLAHRDVLQRVKAAYAEAPDVWLTYGNFVQSNGERSWLASYPAHVHRTSAYRAWSFLASHLRTFRAHLWQRIAYADLHDPTTGKPWAMAWDQAFMFPMLEMAGGDRVRFIPEVTYWYNRHNPANDDKVDGDLQRACAERIQQRPKYAVLP